MTDHDAIAARVRQDRETGTPGPWVQDDMTPAWINMHDCNGTWNVATAHMCCGYPVSGSDANARRIAALPDLEAAYLDLYDEVQRLRAERDRFEAALGRACQVGGTTYLCKRAEKAEAQRIAEWNKRRDAESSLILEKAVCLTAEAERDRLRAALNEIATAASGIAQDIQIGPDDEGRDIYEMALAIRDDARAALKGSEK